MGTEVIGTEPRFRDIEDDRIQVELTNSSLSVEDKLDLQTAAIYIKKLDQPFRTIVEWSYGINGEPELSDPEIARVLQTTPYYINKIRKSGIKKLRSLMGL